MTHEMKAKKNYTIARRDMDESIFKSVLFQPTTCTDWKHAAAMSNKIFNIIKIYIYKSLLIT